jgi:DNA-binding response OmpR family regulator
MPSRDQRLRTPARALLMIKQPVLAEIVKLALNHGQYSARVAQTAAEASVALAEWRPHLAILDMDIAESAILDRLRPTGQAHQLPVIALTRRGDLKAKLAAFERGVDDILTVPFSPEEFVARVLAVMRRSYSDAVEFTPVIRLADLEIDILNRHVRAGETELHLTPLEQSLLYLLAANARGICSRATRSSTTSGAPITWPRATWSTDTSATCGPSSKPTPGDGISPPFRAVVIVSWPRSHDESS